MSEKVSDSVDVELVIESMKIGKFAISMKKQEKECALVFDSFLSNISF